jgi:hypothetical protein
MRTFKAIFILFFFLLCVSCTDEDYSISENIVGTNWKYYPTDDYFNEYYMLKFVSDTEVELWVKPLSNVNGGTLYLEESKTYSVTGDVITYYWNNGSSSWDGSIKGNKVTYYLGEAKTGYTYTFYKK